MEDLSRPSEGDCHKGKKWCHVTDSGHVTSKPKFEGGTGATTRHQPFCHIWKFHGDNFTHLSCSQFCSIFDRVFCNMAAQTVRMHLPALGTITWDFVSCDLNLSRQRGILVRWGEWMICTYWLETLLGGHVIISGYVIGSGLTKNCKFM